MTGEISRGSEEPSRFEAPNCAGVYTNLVGHRAYPLTSQVLILKLPSPGHRHSFNHALRR